MSCSFFPVLNFFLFFWLLLISHTLKFSPFYQTIPKFFWLLLIILESTLSDNFAYAIPLHLESPFAYSCINFISWITIARFTIGRQNAMYFSWTHEIRYTQSTTEERRKCFSLYHSFSKKIKKKLVVTSHEILHFKFDLSNVNLTYQMFRKMYYIVYEVAIR